MDLTSPTPTRAIQTPTPNLLLTPKSPLSGSDTDTEAPPPPPPSQPPLQTHLQKALSLSNGAHRRRPPGDMVVSYRECLKNHAASMGGLALDGCGEFMPAPNSSPLDPTSLKCAACGCHRNFHRRDPSGGHHHSSHHQLQLPALQWTTHLHQNHNNNNNNSSSPSPGQTSSGGGPSPSPSSPAASPTPHHSIYPSAPHMLLALSSAGAGGPVYPDDLTPHHPHHGGGGGGRNQAVQSANLGEMGSLSSPGGRKRARTKFTPEQKVRMHDFAERLGWKMLRGNDDKIVEDFCSQVGVRRNVFKVWMHNNKHRKDKASNNTNNGINNNNNNNNGGGGNGNNIGHGHGHGHFDDDDDGDDDDEDEHVVSVKYDLNGTFSGGHYEGRVRFDTDVFESKVHVHGSSAAAAVAGSSPSV